MRPHITVHTTAPTHRHFTSQRTSTPTMVSLALCVAWMLSLALGAPPRTNEKMSAEMPAPSAELLSQPLMTAPRVASSHPLVHEPATVTARSKSGIALALASDA